MPQEVVLSLSPAQNPDSLDAQALRWECARTLDIAPAEVQEARLRKISFDARPRYLKWRVAVDVWLAGEEVPPPTVYAPPRCATPTAEAPHAVVIGAGPAGLYAALDLLQAGIRVTVLERGKDVQARRRDLAELNRGAPADPDSNYCFGEGGAGTYSDGKLYTRSGSRADVRAMLESLVAHGAPDSILVSWRPHIGSNRLPKVVQSLRESIEACGGDIRFETRATELLTNGDPKRVTGVRTASGETLLADSVVLATGHSALDALQMAAAAGAAVEAKGFAIGVRVEHPQSWVDEQQYHGLKSAAELPPAFYELTTEARGRGVYSFCMCPGGWIVPSQTDPQTLLVNGMSLARRDSPYANSGVVVSVDPADWCGGRGARWGWPDLIRRAKALSDHPLLAGADSQRLPSDPAADPWFGIRLQVALETVAAHAGGGSNRAPAQRTDHFVANQGYASEPLPSSYLPGLTPYDFNALLPEGLASRLREGIETFEKRMPGYVSDQGQIVGVETRTSSPVRLPRDRKTLVADGLAGLYPCGEGAGYAGGIVSAALDGRRVAAQIADCCAPQT